MRGREKEPKWARRESALIQRVRSRVFDPGIQEEARVDRQQAEAFMAAYCDLTSHGSATIREFVATSRKASYWYEQRAFERLVSGDVGGWQDLRDVLEYKWWAAQTFEKRYQRRESGMWHVLDLGVETFSDVLLALHLTRKEIAETFVARLRRKGNERLDEPNHPNDWRLSTGALAFQMKLYELWTGEASGIAWHRLPNMGEYAELLEPECVGERYAEGLAWACDEHLIQARKTNNFPPFQGEYEVLPIELVMWLKLRRRLGLEHSTQQHPLLESPFAALDIPPEAETPSEFRKVLNNAVPHLEAFLRGD